MLVNYICNMQKLFYCILLTVAFSCKKKDKTPPELSVTSPLAMSNFSVFDFISVEGSVHDDKRIDWIQIQLLNISMNSVAEEIVINPNELTYSFSKSSKIAFSRRF